MSWGSTFTLEEALCQQAKAPHPGGNLWWIYLQRHCGGEDGCVGGVSTARGLVLELDLGAPAQTPESILVMGVSL